jgi:hypothetical protein
MAPAEESTMAFFKNTSDAPIATAIDTYPVKAKPGEVCEIPDHKAWVVKAIGLPLVQVDKPSEKPSAPVAKEPIVEAVVEPEPPKPEPVKVDPPKPPARGGKPPVPKEQPPQQPVAAPVVMAEKDAEKPA